jgi:hypothetical protein
VSDVHRTPDGGAYLVAYCVPRRDALGLVVPDCPLCGEIHYHGAAGVEQADCVVDAGHRRPHCARPTGESYWLYLEPRRPQPPTTLSFREWLERQAGRDDPVGDLAGDELRARGVRGYEPMPEWPTREQAIAALPLGACDGAIGAVKWAWWEWNEAAGRAWAEAVSWVYFAQLGDGGPIKIGVAKNPRKRIAGMQTACPQPLRCLATIPGDASRERELHRRFAPHRLRREWFRPAPEILEFVTSVSKEARP